MPLVYTRDPAANITDGIIQIDLPDPSTESGWKSHQIVLEDWLTANPPDHALLNNLGWTASEHTGTGDTIPAFNADGDPELISKNNFEMTSNRLNAFQETPDNLHYISEKLAKDSLDLKADLTDVAILKDITPLAPTNVLAIQQNGYYYTNISNTGLPDGISKDGVIVSVISGVQVYLQYRTLIDNVIRIYENWIEDGVTILGWQLKNPDIDLSNIAILKDTTPLAPTNVLSISENGYYYTNISNTGLPDGISKDGVIVSIVNGVQVYLQYRTLIDNVIRIYENWIEDGVTILGWQLINPDIDLSNVAILKDTTPLAPTNVLTISENGYYRCTVSNTGLPTGVDKTGVIVAIQTTGGEIYLQYIESSAGVISIWENFGEGINWAGWQQIGAGSSYSFSDGVSESGGVVKLGGATAFTESRDIHVGAWALTIDTAAGEIHLKSATSEITVWDGAVGIESNGNSLSISEDGSVFVGEVQFDKTVIQPAYSNTFSASKTIYFNLGNVQYMPVTGDTSITLSNLREGVNILILTNDATAGRVVTIDSTFGTKTRNSAAHSTLANEVNIYTILKYSTIIKYTIETSA